MLDASGRLWISDSGLARIERTSTLTETGDLIGRPCVTWSGIAYVQTLRSRSPQRYIFLGATISERSALVPVVTGAGRRMSFAR